MNRYHPRPAIDRLLDRVEYAEATGCLEFQGARTTGYGVIGVGGRMDGLILTHRLMYEWAKGPIPPGLHIDHLCRNRVCCQPSHLEAVTQGENNRRTTGHNRWTHCKHGHEFTPENTYTAPRGSRECHTCRRLRYKRSRAA